MHGKGGEVFDIGSQLVSTSTFEILPSIISRLLIYLLCLFALSLSLCRSLSAADYRPFESSPGRASHGLPLKSLASAPLFTCSMIQ